VTTPSLRRTRIARVVSLAVALGIWFVPPPATLSPQAWHLFAIFAATILSVVIGAFPILTASVLALAAAVLSGTLSAKAGYAGFANPTIVLIIVAFLVARAVVICGLGQRLGYRAISLFGRSTLGLSYSIFALDALIAPAFPSNTARSGVLFPLALSVTEAAGATPEREDRRRLGRFLMFSGIASLTLSSGLWLVLRTRTTDLAPASRRSTIDGARRLLLFRQPLEHRHGVEQLGPAGTAHDAEESPRDEAFVLPVQKRKCGERWREVKRRRQF